MRWEQRGLIKVWVGLALDDPRHGTEAGYQAHWKLGERACLPCQNANAEGSAVKRAKRCRACVECGVPTSGERCLPHANRLKNLNRTYGRRSRCKRNHLRNETTVTANGNCRLCNRARQKLKRYQVRTCGLDSSATELASVPGHAPPGVDKPYILEVFGG